MHIHDWLGKRSKTTEYIDFKKTMIYEDIALTPFINQEGEGEAEEETEEEIPETPSEEETSTEE